MNIEGRCLHVPARRDDYTTNTINSVVQDLSSTNILDSLHFCFVMLLSSDNQHHTVKKGIYLDD